MRRPRIQTACLYGSVDQENCPPASPTNPQEPTATTTAAITAAPLSIPPLETRISLQKPGSVFKKSKHSKDHTFIIFDWDDTLLPSTWLTNLKVPLTNDTPVAPSVLAHLQTLEAGVLRTLEAAVQCGTVVIITNAEEGWVQLSSERFMPKVGAFLTQHNIRIVSARSIWEPRGFTAVSEWKINAFREEIEAFYSRPELSRPSSPITPLSVASTASTFADRNALFEAAADAEASSPEESAVQSAGPPRETSAPTCPSRKRQASVEYPRVTMRSKLDLRVVVEEDHPPKPVVRNIVSFGDASHERLALIEACKAMTVPHVYKSIKFHERPSINDMCKEHDLMNTMVVPVCDAESIVDSMVKLS